MIRRIDDFDPFCTGGICDGSGTISSMIAASASVIADRAIIMLRQPSWTTILSAGVDAVTAPSAPNISNQPFMVA